MPNAAGQHPIHVLFWNIRQGGGPTRAQAITLELLDAEPDIVCLAECRPTFAGQITQTLRGAGLTHTLHASHAPRTNTVLIASKYPLIQVPTEHPRVLSASLFGPGLAITTVHIPDASNRPERLLAWQALHTLARETRDNPHLILGDVNADRAASPARDGTPIGRLASLGYTDLWLHAGNDPTDPTWAGPRGESARIDHAYASEPLVSRVQSTHHLHAQRHQKLSDHSLLSVRVIPKDP